MLQPRNTKYRKAFRGKRGGVATSNNTVSFGEFGLKTLDAGWIKSREIEAARKAMVRFIKRKGKVWIKIFPQKPYTAKPVNSKIEAGKGALEGYVAVVKPGAILFEISGVAESDAHEALRLAGHKISVRTKVVSKSDLR